MSELVAAGELVHRSGDGAASGWPHTGDGWSTLAWMVKMMSKTNERDLTETGHELLDHELDMVTGGTFGSVIGHIATVAALGAIDWACPEAN